MRSIRTVVLALVLLLCAVPSSSLAQRYDVSVVRDSAGIPHVEAGDFRSLGYGQGFAYAQDNACLFADAVVTVRGERSRFFGPRRTAYSHSNGTEAPNLDSDLFWRWVAASGNDRRLLRGLSPRARGLFRGWAEGFNAYLRRGRLRDPGCRGKPWLRPITALDLARRGLQIETGASSGRFLSGLVDAQPPGAATAAQATPPALDAAALRELTGAEAGDSDLGSNGLAFGSRVTRGGGGLLLANPHFPWRGVDRFWMAHLKVRGVYDAMGGTLGGFPLIGVGFNRDLAWTHTVSTGRRFVAVQLELAPGTPPATWSTASGCR